MNRQSLPLLSFVLWKVSSLHSSVVSPMQPQFSLEKKLVPAITSLPLSAVYLCSAIISIACLTLLLVHNPLLHTLGLSGKSYKIGTGMLIIYSIAAIIRMGNWAQNDTYRSAGDAAFGSIMEITFMYLMVLPFVYLSNFYFHAPFLLVFAFCYIDEPIRYIIMQCHLYSGKWIRPVSDTGLATIDEFRMQHHIEVKSQNQSHNKS